MLPGNNEELAKSMSFAHFLYVVDTREERVWLYRGMLISWARNSHWKAGLPGGDCRDCCLDGKNRLCY
jgi:hypothetical protein